MSGFNLYFVNVNVKAGEKINFPGGWCMNNPLEYIGWFPTEKDAEPFVKGAQYNGEQSGYYLTSVTNDRLLVPGGWVEFKMKDSMEAWYDGRSS